MRSSTRLQTLDGWPSQMGVPRTRMSASRILARRSGQSSPSPSSDLTPGLMLRSATRTISPETLWAFSSSSTSPSSLSVDDFSRTGLSVQLRATAVSGMAGRGARAGARCDEATVQASIRSVGVRRRATWAARERFGA